MAVNGSEAQTKTNLSVFCHLATLDSLYVPIYLSAVRLAGSESHQRVYVLTWNGQWNVSRGPLEYGGVSAASYRCITLNQARQLQHLRQL